MLVGRADTRRSRVQRTWYLGWPKDLLHIGDEGIQVRARLKF